MMKYSDVTALYPMEDLIPVVAKLAEKFTAKESSSVTYEQARKLMKAVIYCIAHLEIGETALAAAGTLPAGEAYRLGYEAVIGKTRNTQEKYNKLMDFFDHYGNRNYRDTIGAVAKVE
ncbi:DUF6179 domain-containing protein [Fusibacillus kribbianus]|uniref:DUF6179 domain-containing protein n=1 Tax=Fusibacillus kribbianus TaxID=3044208 RepID=A0AAP4BD88_9FIRM|nr:DUF6179 domain-containing protein [Ruminococcus sp. YH-rum2234]MDI9242631.1 DUF6179 domain-containing protein [Ruminococcus sp. YH-rum2234]